MVKACHDRAAVVLKVDKVGGKKVVVVVGAVVVGWVKGAMVLLYIRNIVVGIALAVVNTSWWLENEMLV